MVFQGERRVDQLLLTDFLKGGRGGGGWGGQLIEN